MFLILNSLETTALIDTGFKLQTKSWNTVKYIIFITVVVTYWKVNGLLKNKNEITIVIAFLQVVTVTAAKAPVVRTKVKTTCIPKYPVTEKMKAYPYILLGFCNKDE